MSRSESGQPAGEEDRPGDRRDASRWHETDEQRRQRIDEIRRQIGVGIYETPERVELAVGALWEALTEPSEAEPPCDSTPCVSPPSPHFH